MACDGDMGLSRVLAANSIVVFSHFAATWQPVAFSKTIPVL